MPQCVGYSSTSPSAEATLAGSRLYRPPGPTGPARTLHRSGCYRTLQKLMEEGFPDVVAVDALLAGGTFFGGKSEKKSPEGDVPPGVSFCWALCCNWMKPRRTS